jgi:hypothetical protein
MFSTSSVQPRWVTEISFNGLTRLNFSRTSSGGTITVRKTFPSPRNAGRGSGRGDLIRATSPRPLSPVGDGGEGDILVVTTAIRASTGIRFNAILQPTQPARRAVAARGLRLMMADGGNAKLGTSNKLRTSHNIPSPRKAGRGPGRGDLIRATSPRPSPPLRGGEGDTISYCMK